MEIIKIIFLIALAFFFMLSAEGINERKGESGWHVLPDILQYIFEFICLSCVWFAAKIYYTSTIL